MTSTGTALVLAMPRMRSARRRPLLSVPAGRCRGTGRPASRSRVAAAPCSASTAAGSFRRPARRASGPAARLTARATRCCWAPSWMSRSRRRARRRGLSTSRWREPQLLGPSGSARGAGGTSSARSWTPCSTRPGLRRETREQPLLDRRQRRALGAPAGAACRAARPPARRRAPRRPARPAPADCADRPCRVAGQSRPAPARRRPSARPASTGTGALGEHLGHPRRDLRGFGAVAGSVGDHGR